MKSNTSPLTLSKEFAISAPRLFTLLSQPSYLEQWLSPHESIKLTVLKYAFKVGGDFIFEYSIPETNVTELHGKFLTIDEPTELSFTWQWQKPDTDAGIESIVTWTLHEFNNKTTLTIIHQCATNQFYQRHFSGWTGSLERLETLVQTH